MPAPCEHTIMEDLKSAIAATEEKLRRLRAALAALSGGEAPENMLTSGYMVTSRAGRVSITTETPNIETRFGEEVANLLAADVDGPPAATSMVLRILAERPDGLRAPEIAQELERRVPGVSQGYFYTVLKRLRA